MEYATPLPGSSLFSTEVEKSAITDSNHSLTFTVDSTAWNAAPTCEGDIQPRMPTPVKTTSFDRKKPKANIFGPAPSRKTKTSIQTNIQQHARHG
jgi:hypothetical protein